MVSKKYIQATLHSSSPEKNILQTARVREIVIATVNGKKNTKTGVSMTQQ